MANEIPTPTRKRISWKFEALKLREKVEQLEKENKELKSNSSNENITETAQAVPRVQEADKQIKPVVSDDIKTKKEGVEEVKETSEAPLNIPQENAKSKETSNETKDEVKSPVEDEGAIAPKKEVEEMGANNDTPKETSLEVFEEPTEEKPNPDDYDYSCSRCRELFNKEGNYNEETGIIKCPDCGLEVEDA